MNVTLDMPNHPSSDGVDIFPQITEDVKACIHLDIIRDGEGYKVGNLVVGVGDLDRTERLGGFLPCLSNRLSQAVHSVLDSFGVKNRKAKFSIGDSVKEKNQGLAGTPGHSNIARSAAGPSVSGLSLSLPLVAQFLSNPSILEELHRQGKTVNIAELVRLWFATKDSITLEDVIIDIPGKNPTNQK